MAYQQALERVQTSFARALCLRPHLLLERNYRFAGKLVRFRIVGQRLAAQVAAPFDHLLTTDGALEPPDLVVELWDQDEAGVSGPEGFCGPYATRKDKDAADPFTWSVSPDTSIVFHEQRDGLVVFNRRTRRIVGWRTCAHGLSMSERTRPLAWILTTWYHDQGVQVVHAGLVARDRQGVLLAGEGGAGKSTSTLACLCAGFDVLGDDHVGLLRASIGGYEGASMYSSIRVDPDQLARLGSPVSHALPSTDPHDRKSLLLLAPVVPAQLPSIVPIRAIALPRIVDAEQSRVRPCSPAVALRALAPTSIFLIGPSLGRQGLTQLRRLVESVPCYWLELGRTLASVPLCIDQILAHTSPE